MMSDFPTDGLFGPLPPDYHRLHLTPDIVAQLLCPIEDLPDTLPPDFHLRHLTPDIVAQLACPIEDLPNTTPELEPDEIRQLDQPVDNQIGGRLEDHINVGLQYQRRVDRYDFTRSTHDVHFNNLDNIDNLPQFILEVSLLLLLLFLFRYERFTNRMLFKSIFRRSTKSSTVCLMAFVLTIESEFRYVILVWIIRYPSHHSDVTI